MKDISGKYIESIIYIKESYSIPNCYSVIFSFGIQLSIINNLYAPLQYEHVVYIQDNQLFLFRLN